MQKALRDLQVKYKPRQDALQKGQQELSDIQTQLNASQGKLSQAGEADLQARGQRKQTQLQRLSDDLTADFEADRDEAVRKASTRMQELLKKIAEEKGLDLIVDSAAAPFVKPGIEITDQVVAAYDKAYPAQVRRNQMPGYLDTYGAGEERRGRWIKWIVLSVLAVGHRRHLLVPVLPDVDSGTDPQAFLRRARQQGFSGRLQDVVPDREFLQVQSVRNVREGLGSHDALLPRERGQGR